jgi:hypothetical protein
MFMHTCVADMTWQEKMVFDVLGPIKLLNLSVNYDSAEILSSSGFGHDKSIENVFAKFLRR